ncbi:MAG: hypothetical protein F6J93_05490 [Oscillatoria sp. SIO1A7]|nr:hypothetical protein [Oscillatoria sp. SIO1A7]
MKKLKVGDREWRAIAYSMDALVPGLYVWFGSIRIRLGGCEAEDTYPGLVHSFAGVALVLPGYHIYTTYQGSYDPPEQAQEKLHQPVV